MLQQFLIILVSLILASCGGSSNNGGGGGGGGNGGNNQNPGPHTFTLDAVASSLNFPVSMAIAPDGRLFYNEFMTGKTMVLDTNNFNAAPVQFCLSDSYLNSGDERGLLGIVLDPNFSVNHFVYLDYTSSDTTHNRVDRVTDTAGSCTARTNLITLTAGSSHNGGILRFGPDGKLYITIGENTDAAAAQDLTQLKGKILRLNSNGTIPSDNPFFNSATAAHEIWAYGLRNSFGLTFMPANGELWATENGANQDDEINRIVAGDNYGWPNVTGIANTPPYTDPIVAYTPTIAPTGILAVAPSAIYDSQYNNNLFFLDFNNGQMHQLILTADLTQLASQQLIFSGGNGPLLSIIQAPNGQIYVSGTEAIYKLTQH